MPISDEHSVTDLAWAAGFIDGDGVISMYKRKDRRQEFRVVVRAMNTNRIALDKLHVMFGGSVHPMINAEDACARGWKPSFYWSAGDCKAEQAIKLIAPFLVLKREQAALALRARDKSFSGSLDAMLLEFRRLNRKGKG